MLDRDKRFVASLCPDSQAHEEACHSKEREFLTENSRDLPAPLLPGRQGHSIRPAETLICRCAAPSPRGRRRDDAFSFGEKVAGGRMRGRPADFGELSPAAPLPDDETVLTGRQSAQWIHIDRHQDERQGDSYGLRQQGCNQQRERHQHPGPPRITVGSQALAVCSEVREDCEDREQCTWQVRLARCPGDHLDTQGMNREEGRCERGPKLQMDFPWRSQARRPTTAPEDRPRSGRKARRLPPRGDRC